MGKKDCPAGNECVYDGYAGGNPYHTKAGPATILCLPKQPLYASHTPGKQGGSYIYGTEYETIRSKTGFKRLHNQDMPCAVCRSHSRRNVMMLPARNRCFPGWRLEYWGYLMGGHYNFGSSEYICVDGNSVASTGGHENKNGQVLYQVEARCGSLPCPPYRTTWELTCAVCSKE